MTTTLTGSSLAICSISRSGDDNLLHGDRYRWSLRFTVINVTNKIALYNFLSSFTGTHFVTPRAETVELGFHF